MSDQTGSSSLLINISAIVGLISGLIGSFLSIYNFRKAWKKDKKEARIRGNQHLVKAKYVKSKTDTGRPASDLLVVNTDTYPVSNITIDFFDADSNIIPQLKKNIPCLGPNKEEFIYKFT